MIVCKKCGTIDDYRTIDNNQHKMAYCNSCDAWIKNMPYKDPQFYFGKYKGQYIAHVNDLFYLKWVRDNVKMAVHMRNAVNDRIYSLETMLR